MAGLSISISDGALGLVGEPTDAVTLLTGVSSSGSTSAVTRYEGADAIADMVGTYGYGPLTEAAALLLTFGGAPVVVSRIAASTAGTSTTPALSGTSATMTLTGAPYDDYEGYVRVKTGGTLSALKVDYSLDGGPDAGNTFSGEIALNSATQYAIPNTGLTLNFVAGTYVAGDYWTWTSSAPTFSTTVLETAIQNALDSVYAFKLYHMVGRALGSTDAIKSALYEDYATSVQSKLATAEAAYRYVRAILDSPALTNSSAGDTEVISAFSAFAGSRAHATAGQIRVKSPLNARKLKRSVAWAAMARARIIAVQESLGFVGRGNLGVDFSNLELDARVRTSATSARFMCLRTHVNKPGYYIDQPNSMASPGSDFSKLQRGRVIDKACEQTYLALIDYLQKDLFVNATTGKILETEARGIETVLNARLFATLIATGNASAVTAVVNRDDNILSTENLRVNVRVTTKAYATTITSVVGFNNPTVVPVQGQE